ncbi:MULTISPECIES: flagellar biosynthetic protein FliO [unclassified Pusillimonas]|uniref:flagellar biosynthetic protein FliO n=1 Tax=unclassified Pusillimonas TaxID=2640016 RepID=UPI001303E25C|nr:MULTISPECIES: flagellar biosynthetic protein FliO [unclassified Pusillimonas]
MNAPEVLQPILALLFILALILGGAWLARRAGLIRGRSQQDIKVVSSYSLGGRGFITIVEVEDTRLVLGVTPQNISLLHTLPPANSARQDAGTPKDTV